MTTPQLSQIFEYNISRNIEGVIKADDDSHLAQEVKEFVITSEVARKLERQFLDAYNESGGTNGVWISGFYGSGKSHLLKMLSVLLENREVDGESTGERFAGKVDEENTLLSAALRKAANIPARSILFNIDQKAVLNSTGKTQEDAVLAVFMSVFNEMRGYYPRLAWLADLERRMDKDGIYDDFKRAFHEQTGKDWDKKRYQVDLMTVKFAKAYAAVTEAEVEDAKDIFKNARKDYVLTIERFAEEVNDYLMKQPADFRLNFFVDEVGQYIGDNTKLMTNLQTIAESLYTRCNGRAWVFVTSQEDIDAVLGGLKNQQSQDFSKIQARFGCKLNLTSQNVDEVIELRLLKKNEVGQAALAPIYQRENKNFATVLSFHEGGTEWRVARNEAEYVRKYPFQPYHFDLLQNCIRALSNANALMGKHASVGERSLLSIFQDVIKKMSEDGQPIGNLPTFDRCFDGLQPILKGEVQSSLNTAINHLDQTPFDVRVLKVLFLVKYVKNFEATAGHLTALLTERFDQDQKALQERVQTSLNRLTRQIYVLRNGTKYEYLTDEEKDIEAEINATDVDRAKINAELGKMLIDQSIDTRPVVYPANKQKFSFNRQLDGTPYGRQLNELTLNVITSNHEFSGAMDMLSSHSLGKPEVLFVLKDDLALRTEIEAFLKTAIYLKQNSIREGEKGAIIARRIQENQQRQRVIVKLAEEALSSARIIIGGEEAKDIGTSKVDDRVAQAIQRLIEKTYHNLRMLPSDFSYEDATRALTNPSPEIDDTVGQAEKEILDYVVRQAATSHRVTAKALLDRFGTKPYGWSEGATATILARLIASGRLEANADGNELDNRAAADYLGSNRKVAHLVVRPLAEINNRQVKQLKDLHRELFHQASPGREAKDTAQAFLARTQEAMVEARRIAKRTDDFPFVSQLKDFLDTLERVNKLRHNELYEHFDLLNELADHYDDTYTPIKSFVDGAQGKIYQDIRLFLDRGRENHRYLDQAEYVAPLTAALAEEQPYRGGLMSRAKAQLDAAHAAVQSRLDKLREEVRQELAARGAELKSMEEYADLTDIERGNLDRSLEAHERDLTDERSITGFQNALRAIDERIFGELANQVAALSVLHRENPPSIPPKGGGPQDSAGGSLPPFGGTEGGAPNAAVEEPKPKYSPLPKSRELRDRVGLSFLKDEADLERYLKVIRDAGRDILRRGEGIRI